MEKSNLTLTELIDTEILSTQGRFFRNREIVSATGASRAHVSQRLAKLYDQDIVTKAGQEWMLRDQGKLVAKLLNTARENQIGSSRWFTNPENFDALIDAIVLLKNQRNHSWEAVAYRLEDELLQELNDSIEVLRSVRDRVRSPRRKPGQIFQMLSKSGKYAEKLENQFKNFTEFILGEKLTDKVIIDDIRPKAKDYYDEKD